jgi:hypothetical protein
VISDFALRNAVRRVAFAEKRIDIKDPVIEKVGSLLCSTEREREREREYRGTDIFHTITSTFFEERTL